MLPTATWFWRSLIGWQRKTLEVASRILRCGRGTTGGKMPESNRFAVFSQDKRGAMCTGFFDDLEAAKDCARKGAESGHFEFFVCSFVSASEVARFLLVKRISD
jgi:hypothetical protein